MIIGKKREKGHKAVWLMMDDFNIKQRGQGPCVRRAPGPLYISPAPQLQPVIHSSLLSEAPFNHLRPAPAADADVWPRMVETQLEEGGNTLGQVQKRESV